MTEHERQKAIEKVIKQRKRMDFLIRLSRRGASKIGQEKTIRTEYGPVRTICYGFEDASVKPVFFDLHGGGFILLNADADEKMNAIIHQDVGCKVVSIDYGLAPEHPFPVALNQVHAVIKAMHANAASYGIDPESMAIGGYSAGGNLATATCMPLDLATSPYDKPCPKGSIKPETAATYDACYISPDDAKNPLASPVYASRDDLARMPPAIIILAGGDSLHDEGAKYASLLKNAGVDAQLHDFQNERHGFHYFRSKAIPEAMKLAASFLKEHLWKQSYECS